MSSSVVLKCPKCGEPVPPDDGHERVRTCEACHGVYKVVDHGFATRLLADPDAPRPDVGRRLVVFAALVLLAIVFFAMALYVQFTAPR